jgi:hypothetical protein
VNAPYDDTRQSCVFSGASMPQSRMRFHEFPVYAHDSPPEMARDIFRLQADEYAAVQTRLDKIEAKLMKWHREVTSTGVSRRFPASARLGPPC